MLEQLNIKQKLAVLSQSRDTISEKCNDCDLCQKECSFLKTYGTPGAIVEQYITDPTRWLAASYECSLCGLCTVICPQATDPASMFLGFRQQAVDAGIGDFPEHQGLINYENKGTSQKYTFYSLPTNCDTIFFPGCALPGTRPKVTLKTYHYLQRHIKHVGIVLDCCTKPSHDLGHLDYFARMFTELKRYLRTHDIRTIIVACPSCHKQFKTYGSEFTVKTVYDVMAEKGIDKDVTVSGKITIHDPCQVRFEKSIHASVRSIAKERGVDIVDTPHQKENTFCCGEGGAVTCLAPNFAQNWTKKRMAEAHSHKTASYCAGCVHLLSKQSKAFHILDLVFDPENAINDKARVSKAPFTYLNRLKLKKQLQKLPAAATRERRFNARKESNSGTGIKLYGRKVATITRLIPPFAFNLIKACHLCHPRRK